MDVREFEATLEECEIRLDRLRALYEQYFQGIERLEPLVPKKELHRKVQLLRGAVPRSTRLRFRFQQLVSRYTTYQSYWMRVARQIEEGTYRRDIMKVRRKRDERRQARSEADASRDGISIEVDLDAMDLDAEVAAASAEAAAVVTRLIPEDDVLASIDNLGSRSRAPSEGPNPSMTPYGARPLTPLLSTPAPGAIHPPRNSNPPSKTFPKPTARAAPATPTPTMPTQNAAYRPPSPGGPPRRPAVVARRPSSPPAAQMVGGPDDEGMRRVYQRYVEARRRNNERVDNLRFESVKKSIEAQMPKLRQKHQGKKIEFEVVIRNGKVGLKPVPK